MDKRILRMEDPKISSYTSYGCLFSLIDDQLWPWVYNNFIQIRYARDWGILVFDSHHILLKNCPGISFYNFPRKLVKSRWNSYKEAIIESVDLGYYVFIYVDRYYLSQTSSYAIEHFPHELLIYGYDLDNNIFYVADNFFNGRFIRTECSFDEIEQGYGNIPTDYDFWSELRLLKKNDQFDCNINIEQIAYSLDNYLHSRKTFDLLHEQECDFGFQAIYKLIVYIKDTENDGGILDIRGFHLLYEHKILMKERVWYLITKNFIAQDVEFLEQCSNLKEDYLILRNLVLKYNISKEKHLLQLISDKLAKNIILEKKFISDFIKKIKS